VRFSYFLHCVACELHPAYPGEFEIDEVQMQLPFCVFCLSEFAELIDHYDAVDCR
jgi:hypothetical protein